MLIVSQDKDNIVNFKNIVSIGMEDFDDNNSWQRITAETIGTSVVLGDYKSEERAKEILQQIIGKYNEYAKIQNGVGSIASVAVLPKIYEMPKE